MEVATDVAVRTRCPCCAGDLGRHPERRAPRPRPAPRVGLARVLTDDDLGRAIAARVEALGIRHRSAPLHRRSAGGLPGALGRIADSATSVVTLTITEKGYRIDPHTGTLNTGDDQVRADLAGRPPQKTSDRLPAGSSSAPAPMPDPSRWSVRQPARQREAHPDPRACLRRRAPGRRGGAAAVWLGENVTFPNTMVDRMVPATTAGDLDAVERELGLRDEAAVVAEPFLQWVIEDNFASRRRAGRTPARFSAPTWPPGKTPSCAC